MPFVGINMVVIVSGCYRGEGNIDRNGLGAKPGIEYQVRWTSSRPWTLSQFIHQMQRFWLCHAACTANSKPIAHLAETMWHGAHIVSDVSCICLVSNLSLSLSASGLDWSDSGPNPDTVIETGENSIFVMFVNNPVWHDDARTLVQTAPGPPVATDRYNY